MNNLGAVITYRAYGTSHEGFDAEWREIAVSTVESDLVNRCELFDEADLDAALARFEELLTPTRRLENAASRAEKRLHAYFAARDWDAMAELLPDDPFTDDRRPVVGAGLRSGRDAVIAEARAIADVGAKNAALTVIAIRGERLALIRSRFSGRDQRPEAFHTESLCIVEVDGDGLMAQHIMFDPDDFDAAFAELDTRYVAGEAADHSAVWSIIAQGYAALNRQELPAMTPDWEEIDHRRLATIEAGELATNMRAAWDVTPNIKLYIEAVHRLGHLGAVFTRVTHGTSRKGFDAEWRAIDLLTLDGHVFNRCEIFDERDLSAAIARFDELSPPTPLLENAAPEPGHG